jgi:BirA family biotin operon repressor/biotin-[acetyl-CoA-carboxylase] ligase
MEKQTYVEKTTAFFKKNPNDFVKKIYVFDTVDSTNITAKELACEGAQEGTLVIASAQNHGRGRFDRTWQSPTGGVYISLILKPKTSMETISLLPLIAGLAVSKTIERYHLHPTIKWPNDIRTNGKKIAGILLESEGKGPIIDYVVVGIGINLNIDIQTLSSDIQPYCTSVSTELQHQVDYHEFLKELLVQYAKFYKIFQKQNYETIRTEWRQRTDTLGKTIRVKTSLETLQGTAVDIDQAGFLILKTITGEMKKIYSGDCLYLDDLHHA